MSTASRLALYASLSRSERVFRAFSSPRGQRCFVNSFFDISPSPKVGFIARSAVHNVSLTFPAFFWRVVETVMRRVLLCTILCVTVAVWIQCRSPLMPLHQNWRMIRLEVSQLPFNIHPTFARKQTDWGESFADSVHDLHESFVGWVKGWKHDGSPDDGWLNFALVFGGKEVRTNAATCPVTMRVLRQIPGVSIAGFSWLRPHTVIHRHRDHLPNLSRTVHLGLVVPSDEATCHLIVQGKNRRVRTYEEREGRVIEFDSRHPHWAHNFSDEERIILYVDLAL